MYIEHTLSIEIIFNEVYLKRKEIVALLLLEANCDKHCRIARDVYLDLATQLANIKGLKV